MFFLRVSACLVFSCAFFAAAAPVYTPKINWVDCAKHVPGPGTALITSGLNLSALPVTLHCGQMGVPVDYSKPISATNNITLGLAMYRPPKPQGLLFFCPGGTDAGAAAAWQVALNQTGPFVPDFSGLEMFDILMMDIRGTFSSNILNVSTELITPLLGAYPTNEEQFNAFKAASSKLFKSFSNLSKPSALVQHTGTDEVVQDYDNLRKALGYEKVHFLGLSYGSYRAAQYATTFPKRVGRFVLDAVIPHGMTLYDQAQSEIAAANRGLLRADAYCQNNATCPFNTDGRGSVPKVYNEILAALKNSTTLTPALAQSLIYSDLGGQTVFPDILNDLYAAASGKANTLSEGSNGALPLSAVVALPYICTDGRVLDNTWSGFEQAFKAAEKFDPLNIAQATSLQYRLWCAGWEFATVPLEPLKLEAAMLLVTADFDVSTPIEKALFTWHQANNSALVVRHGDDHTSFNLPNTPSTAITKQFLRTGVLPKARNQTLVSVYEPGMKFEGIANPYNVPTGYQAGDCPEDSECNLV